MNTDLRAARMAASLTQKRAAALIGVPLRTYQNWEYGVRTPPPYILKMALEILKKKKKNQA